MEGLVTVNTGTRDKGLEHRKSYSTALALFVPGIPHPSAKDAKQQGLFLPGEAGTGRGDLPGATEVQGSMWS